jgi:hypothetical protein
MDRESHRIGQAVHDGLHLPLVHDGPGIPAAGDLDAVAPRGEQPDAHRRGVDREGFAGLQLAQAHVQQALRKANPDALIVQLQESEFGLCPKADGGRADVRLGPRG